MTAGFASFFVLFSLQFIFVSLQISTFRIDTKTTIKALFRIEAKMTVHPNVDGHLGLALGCAGFASSIPPSYSCFGSESVSCRYGFSPKSNVDPDPGCRSKADPEPGLSVAKFC
jgi:hypothetical protein